MAKTLKIGDRVVLDRERLNDLLETIRGLGYEIHAPTVSDGAIGIGPIESDRDLPMGWRDRQDAGTYRLERRNDEALFGYAVGPHSWKRLLFPPRRTLWQAEREGSRFHLLPMREETPRSALFGVRPCEMAAIGVQDRVFLSGPYRDADYARRRQSCLIVVVDCHEPGGACFCDSLGTGPEERADGWDLAMTELLQGHHRFLARAGSARGLEVLGKVAWREATPADLEAASKQAARAAKRMGRRMDPTGAKEILYESASDGHREEIAQRCLMCGNCTMACPTCFCVTVQDTTSLDGSIATRERTWDSCFSLEYSYIHGGSVRFSPYARYRHWMTHKLASWQDQFGTMGCVGCGRCIVWCPVGIDITEELEAFRANVHRKKEAAR